MEHGNSAMVHARHKRALLDGVSCDELHEKLEIIPNTSYPKIPFQPSRSHSPKQRFRDLAPPGEPTTGEQQKSGGLTQLALSIETGRARVDVDPLWIDVAATQPCGSIRPHDFQPMSSLCISPAHVVDSPAQSA